MYLKAILFFTITASFFLLSSGKNKKSCEKQRNNFTEKNVEFFRCAMQHTLPSTNIFCTDCLDAYVVQLQSYRKFVSSHDSHSDTMLTCGEIYLNKDRLNILVNGYESARNLWNSGSCTNCFNCDPDNLPADADIKHLCNATQNLLQFTELTNATQTCFLNSFNQGQNACKTCLDPYTKQKNLFQSLKSASNGGLCFNIEDMMNRAQRTWTAQLACDSGTSGSKGWSLLSIFLLLVLIGGISSGGYYGYLYAKQRNYFQGRSTSPADDDERSNLNDSAHGFASINPLSLQ